MKGDIIGEDDIGPIFDEREDGRDDGGPAYPQACADALDVGMVHTGMSLRDRFAIEFAGVMTAHAFNMPKDQEAPDAPWIAQKAYVFADAMLKARKQP